MSFAVAIVGRPNVGKSTLFNRLVGQRLALVDDRPGVTRDRREGEGRLADLRFRVIDTAGYEDEGGDTLEARMRQQTGQAIAGADVVLMVIDAREGVTPLDEHFAAWLRRSGKPVVLAANKSEGRAGQGGVLESFSLGLGDPVPISAEHGEGMADLYEALAPFAAAEDATEEPPAEEAPVEEPPADEPTGPRRPLQLAIIGRPNVGKSTLVNRLIGEERLLTGPEAGITRDAIGVDWRWRDRAVRLVDTAGLRRRSRVEDKLEKLSVADTLRTVRFAEVVVLVLDATQGFDKQDLTIARLVENEGRALVLAINKWDAVEDRQATLDRFRDRVEASLPQLQGVATVTLSGKTGQGLDRLMEAVTATYEVWNRRLGTPVLNRWLAAVQERHPPPLVDGRRLKLRYMTQANVRPPTFALFASKPGELPESYRRYLVNAMREDFELPGVPIRVMLRKGRNPYAGKD